MVTVVLDDVLRVDQDLERVVGRHLLLELVEADLDAGSSRARRSVKACTEATTWSFLRLRPMAVVVSPCLTSNSTCPWPGPE